MKFVLQPIQTWIYKKHGKYMKYATLIYMTWAKT